MIDLRIVLQQIEQLWEMYFFNKSFEEQMAITDLIIMLKKQFLIWEEDQ